MIRLFKRDDSGKIAAYHEAWIEPKHRRIVEHWGYVGEAGETATHRIKILGSLEKQFTETLEPARALGFEELSDSDYATLIIEFPVSGNSVQDEDTQSDVEDALTEKLGWTGLGYCDDGRITAGTVEICCRVLDVDLATREISQALDGSVFANYSRIYQE